MKVTPRLQSQHGIVQREHGVGRDCAVESPFAEFAQQLRVIAGIRAVDLVVGAHHAGSAAGLDGLAKSGIVDLVQGAFGDDFVDAGELGEMPDAIPIPIVAREVLDHGDHVTPLERCYFGSRHLSIEEWVFTEGLCAAAPMPGAHDIQSGSDDLRASFGAPFLGKGRAEIAGAPAIPGGGKRNLIGKGGYAECRWLENRETGLSPNHSGRHWRAKTESPAGSEPAFQR